MTAALAAFCAVLGLIIGSFLNVVIWRVPRGESIAHPPSRCPSCETPIRPYDNVPVVSWLVLRGRCRACKAPISARYPAVELGTGVLFGALALRLGWSWSLPAFLYLGAIAVALALIDLDTHKLPNAIVLPSYGVAAALLALASLAGGDTDRLVPAAAGMAGLYAVYFALWFAYPKGMGFGDVKLAGVLGMYLGWLGWQEWLVGWLAGFLLGGLAGVVLLAVRRASRKSAVPYGPFLIAGALLSVFAGGAIAEVWLGGLTVA